MNETGTEQTGTIRFVTDMPDNAKALESKALEVVDQESARRWLAMRQGSAWEPPTDVYEAEDRLVVQLEIAGIDEAELQVALKDRHLTISGTRQRIVRDLRAYQQMEIRYGEFRTEVILPWLVNREQVNTVYKDGFLRVELPRAFSQQIRIVDVDSGPEAN